ncbi:MAG: hypothetical protein QXJ93_01630, partial [Candidatus Rehaiarchaeum fermentans]|nr:hypothetical protein [Candidatus Rehaiarchaeum fermentans]
ISRCNFYIELAKEWGLDPSSSVFCTDFESYQKSKFARRPEDTSLNISKLSETLKITLPSVQEEIANLKMLEGDYFEYWREKRV